MNLAVCIPLGDFCDSGFTNDLSIALAYHAAVHDDHVNVHYREGTILPEQRNSLCKIALEHGADYVIFLDSDMRFPKDTFERLMSWDKPVVAANCAKRRRPISATARIEDPEDPSSLIPIWPERGETGLKQCTTIGTAVMGMKSDVLFKAEWPWFDMPWMDSAQRFLGEDVFFCSRLKRAEIPIYIDTGLSWEVRHVGKYEFGLSDVLAEHAMAEAGLWDHLKVAG